MPTTPVHIDVQTQPNGDVQVSIWIAAAAVAAAQAAGPRANPTQLNGGAYGVEGLTGVAALPQGGILVEPSGAGWQETWILEDTPANLDAFKTQGFRTRYLGAAVDVADTLAKAGLTGPTTNIVMNVQYQPIPRGGAVPTPPTVPGVQPLAFCAWNLDPAGNRTTPFPLAFLYRSFDPTPGGMKQDIWAFAQNFQLADDTVQIEVEPWNLGPVPSPSVWANLATAHCPGGTFTIIAL